MTVLSRRPDRGRLLRLGACLSLSGTYGRFGEQARLGLEIWRSWDGSAELIVEDDRSDPGTVETVLRRLATRCDILLGPYSTHLMRRAGDVAADLGLLLWNHGGSGDDVQAAHPGHVVSVLTPASRYADPFLDHLARTPGPPPPLWIIHGRGGFGRQVAAGAAAKARTLGIDGVRFGPGEDPHPPEHWNLLCAASFEEDVATVRWARALPAPPRAICAVAAGVREFGEAIAEPAGIFGVGQWFPGGAGTVALGPPESDFLAAYHRRTGHLPDYPAVQAAAAAVIAAHCARSPGPATRDARAIATSIDTTTLFGRFTVDPSSGAQTGHEPVLVRWDASAPKVWKI